MIQVFFIKPFTSLAKITEIPFDRFISFEMALSTGLASKCTIEMTPSVGIFYNIFRDNLDSGFRVVETNSSNQVIFDMAFVKDNNEQAIETNGVLKINFISSLNLLERNQIRKLPYYSNYTGLSAGLINVLSNNIQAQLISGDIDINFNTGKLNNLEMVEYIMELQPNWTFIDAGINTGDQTILKYGDFSNLPPIAVAGNLDIDNIYNLDVIPIYGVPSLETNNDIVTFLLAVGNPSRGNSADAEVAIILDNPNADYIDPNYPLIDTGEKTIDGRIMYRILNKTAFTATGLEIYGNFDGNTPANNQDNDGNQNFKVRDAQANLYNNAVSSLKKNNFGVSYNFEFDYPRLYYPNTGVIMNYSNSIKNIDGTTTDFILENKIIYLNTINYDILYQASKPSVK